MDTHRTISTKLDVREFAPGRVGDATKTRILEAARLTGSSKNTQHWRFILVQSPDSLATLARDSTTGGWVKGSDFAVIVSIDPNVSGSVIDAGRVAQDMQLAAWEQGVASGLFTGMNAEALARDFGIPQSLRPAVVVGFGYPKKRLLGRKNRKPLSELAFLERYGNPLGPIGHNGEDDNEI